MEAHHANQRQLQASGFNRGPPHSGYPSRSIMSYASVIRTGVLVWYLTSVTRAILEYNLIRQTSGLLAYLNLCNAFDRVKDGYLFGMLEAFRLPPLTIPALFAKKCRIRSPWLV